MQLVEITLSAEEKIPGARQFEMHTRGATVKIAMHPGDTLADVLAHGRDVLRRALADAPAPQAAEERAPRAAVARAPRGDAWVVRVAGARAADARFRQLAMRYVDGEFVGEYDDEATARKRAEAADLMGNVTVTVTPPAGGA